MYGVPQDLKLQLLHGAELIQLGIGMHQVQFVFHPEGNISVEGDWVLYGADGSELDRRKPQPRHEAFQLHRLLGQRVVSSSVSAPKWFELRFEHGELLRIFDSSKQYE